MKRTDSHEQTERRFQGALHVAAGLLGWLVPDTDALVDATSLEDDNIHGDLPRGLRDPLSVLDCERLNVAQGRVNCCDESEVTVERSSLNLLADSCVNAE